MSDKKELIFQAALRLFNEEGFDRTPTALISKEAGISTGTLFNYFSTKETLINELYLKCKDSMFSSIVKDIDKESTYKRKYKKIWHNSIMWGFNNRDMFLFFLQYGNSPRISEETKNIGFTKFEPIFNVFRDGIKEEIIKDSNIEFLIRTSIAIITESIHYFNNNPDKLRDEDFINMSFDLFWNYVKN